MVPNTLKNEFMNQADFLHTDCDPLIFGQNDILLFIFDF